MSLVSRLRVGAARANPLSGTLSNPDEGLKVALGVTTTYSGKTVTPATALEIPAFWRGIRILSNAVGSLPCKVYRPIRPLPDDGGRETVPRTSRPWQLLHDKPNPTMAADEFWALAESHLDLWGNAFIWKERGADGRVANLWALNPARVQVGRIGWDLTYVIDGAVDAPASSVDILHIRALSSDGMVGYSPVQVARQQIGADLAQHEFRGRFWENDATPGVVLIHPNKLEPAAIERLRALWDNRHRGTPNKRRTAVLGEAIDVQQMQMPLEDAQFIEQQRMSSTQIAHVLDLPPYMLAGDNGGNSLTYTTVEGQSIDFLKWSLSPRLVRIQNAVTRDDDIMLTSWFAEFDTGAILRTTTKESYDALAVARWMTVDEKRGKTGLAALPDGKGSDLDTGLTKAAEKPTGEQAPEPQVKAFDYFDMRRAERIAREGKNHGRD